MNNLITEDIIKNAVNESIDNFMLEEGFKDTWNALKNSGLGKVWNGLKNGVSMYMDWRTNGQWNNKYGIYANGNGKMTEMYYLNKWFNIHINNIKRIASQNENPNSISKEYRIDPNTKEKIYVDKQLDYNNIQQYVWQNVTPENFNNWVKNYIQNRKALECIDNYIRACSNSISDIQSAMNMLSITAFLADKNGKAYMESTKQQLDTQRNDYEAKNNEKMALRQNQQNNDTTKAKNEEYKNIYVNIESKNGWRNYILKFSGVADWYSKIYPVIEKSIHYENEKKWLLSIINKNARKDPKSFANEITFKNFLNVYGDYYK